MIGNQGKTKPVKSNENLSHEDKLLLEEFWHILANITRRVLTSDNRERDNCDIVEEKEQ